ncbi:tetratricopeptide repeat protein [Gemmobacter denitrificans]|uniref:Tetratricopeptide repeat protein n=1 Tax=Gemmobacter denitrificans TaxID=3123040 RepID=A0ABU8BUG0_9RHOB
MSEGQTRARAALQEMFWGNTDRDRAAGSLRTALTHLRQELAPLGEGVLLADSNRVWLAPGAIRVDWGPDGGAQLLEGLDLRLGGAESFEEWLRAARAARPAPETCFAVPASSAPMGQSGGNRRARIGLGLLACRVPRNAPDADLRANLLLDRIAAVLVDLVQAELFDWRDRPVTSAPPVFSSGGPCLMLQMVISPGGAGFGLRLLECGSSRLLWTAEPVRLPPPARDDGILQEEMDFVGRMVERLIPACTERMDREDLQMTLPYQALVSMFRLDPSALDAVEGRLKEAWRDRQEAVHLSLLNYLSTIRAAEHIGRVSRDMQEQLGEAVRRNEAEGGFGAIGLAANGYALLFHAGERNLAGELLTRAVQISPSQAFCWDHLALFRFATGQLSGAQRASDRALALGGASPLRYTYDTTACMIALAQGDYQAAIRHGNRALVRMPRFSPALRYTASAMGHLGLLQEARALVRQLRSIAPRHIPPVDPHAPKLRPAGLDERLDEGLRRAGYS